MRKWKKGGHEIREKKMEIKEEKNRQKIEA